MSLTKSARVARNQSKINELLATNRRLVREIKRGTQKPARVPHGTTRQLLLDYVASTNGTFTTTQVAKVTGKSLSLVNHYFTEFRNKGIVSRTREDDHASRKIYTKVSTN